MKHQPAAMLDGVNYELFKFVADKLRVMVVSI